ncbi:unnamed protein product [Heterobilharzia americana]|nr:unnamed protein product [Heterobilharzia americana]
MDWKLYCRNVKRLDLEEVKKTTEAFKNKSKNIETKILELSNACQSMKSNSTLRIHTKTWRKEMSLLKSEENEIEKLLKNNCYSWIFKEESVEDTTCENSLKAKNLQNMLSNSIRSLRKTTKELSESGVKDECIQTQASVKQAIQNMHDCLQELSNNLSNEESELLKQQEDGDDIFLGGARRKSLAFSTKEMGIPEYAWDWECPDDEYLSSMLSEFVVMDFEFYNRLEIISKEYESVRSNDLQLWSLNELELFEYIWDVYKRHLIYQRRHYTLDFLSRLFPKHSNKELTDLLNHCDHESHLRDRAITINRMWKKSRDDLSIRIQATLLQIVESSNEKRNKAEKYQSQKELCNFLKEQVQRWRKEKLEMNELEERKNAEIKAQHKEAEAKKKAKENAARKAIKIKIAEHQSMKQRQAQNEAARLKFLRDMHAKQSRIDMARLKESQDLYLSEVKQKRLFNQLEKDRLANEREIRLENLRRKVRPNVLPNPSRSTSETESWRLKIDEHLQSNENTSETQVSYASDYNRFGTKLYTFTNAQLCADHRTRLTAALHSAGVLDSDYARILLSNISSNRQTRKDTMTSKEFREAINDSLHDSSANSN